MGLFILIIKVTLVTLMAICDAHVFTFVDILNNDSGIFRNSTVGKSFFNETMNLPSPDVVDECSSLGEFPYF